MATITLDYNPKSVNAKKTLQYILEMGLFKLQTSSLVHTTALSERRQQLDKELDKYPIDLSDYKFNRDEANK